MTTSFTIFFFLCSVLIIILCWIIGIRITRNRIRRGKGDYLGFLVFFGGLPLGVLGTMLICRLFVFPAYAENSTYNAMSMKDIEENGNIIQMLTYEDGTEINLTEKTGKYYTKMPTTELKREHFTFLWVVEWDHRRHTGLDFVDRK